MNSPSEANLLKKPTGIEACKDILCEQRLNSVDWQAGKLIAVALFQPRCESFHIPSLQNIFGASFLLRMSMNYIPPRDVIRSSSVHTILSDLFADNYVRRSDPGPL